MVTAGDRVNGAPAVTMSEKGAVAVIAPEVPVIVSG